MKIEVKIKLLPYFCLFLLSLLSCKSEEKETKPNVIIVMTDDQGYGDFSIFGNPVVQTPNMDKLYDESIRFTNFHVAPVCTPTRSQLMTGIDAMHNGAYIPHGQLHLLNKGLTTIGEIFQENDYKTALYGKWHLGGNSIGYRPHERGFDDAVYFLRGGIWSCPNYWNNDLYDDQYFHNGIIKEFKGYANDTWFDLGKDFIKKCSSNQESFFLYLPVNSPHLPWLVPEKYRKPYLNKNLDKESINFFAMINAVDDRLGDLISFLKDEKLWDNTIFIFTTDNGSTLWHQEYNAGMKGKKGSIYEGGHRVPLFFSWPNGKFGQARDIDNLTIVQDILPTLIDLCNLQVSKSLNLSGENISNLFRGEELSNQNNRIEVVQFSEEKYKGAVMYKNWRLINGRELYDLSQDLAQKTNVADQQPEIMDTLLKHYEIWWKKIVSEPQPYIIDGKEEVMLTSYDWYDGPRVYNFPHIRRGDKGYGKYRIIFNKEGKYQLSLRRWPKEADMEITGSVPAYKTYDPFIGNDSDYGGNLEKGKVLDIIKARIEIGSLIKEIQVNPEDKESIFNIYIPNGETQLKTWFIDKNGDEFGAYYTYINKLIN